MVERLIRDRNVLIRELVRQVPSQENQAVILSMEAMHAEICLPMFEKGRLMAVLSMDQKKNKEMYHDLDLAALWGLARAAEDTLRSILTRDEIVKKERMAAIGEMASMVGHEIRNPLTVISNSTYYLEKKFPELSKDEAAAKHFSNINAQVRSANKIIEDILDYARNRDLILEEGSINDVIRQTLSSTAVPDNVKVFLELSGDDHKSLFDKDEISQAVTNLIHNALEAMPGGGTLKIESALLPSGEIEMLFTDTGCGISKENLDRIFEPLFTTKSKGTGLGMAIVKKIVDHHKGTISVNSEPGKGTTMIVRL